MPNDNFLPSEAILELKGLMHLFKTSLNGYIVCFEQDEDEKEFGIGIHKLRQDLIVFKEIFEYWHQNADTSKEYRELDDLAKELGEAQNLLCEANQMLKGKL